VVDAVWFVLMPFFHALGLLFLDSNNLTGDLDNVICKADKKTFVVADCDDEGEVTCSCCDKCCQDNDPCNDENLIPSNDPIWRFGYQRIDYFFGGVGYENIDAP
jgi:hypothetical protein